MPSRSRCAPRSREREESEEPVQRRAGQNEESAFCKELAEHRAAGRAERHAETEIVLTRGVARDDEHRHVTACNDKNERNERHEDADGFGVVVADPFKTSGRSQHGFQLLLFGGGCLEIRESCCAKSRGQFGDSELRCHRRSETGDETPEAPTG